MALEAVVLAAFPPLGRLLAMAAIAAAFLLMILEIRAIGRDRLASQQQFAAMMAEFAGLYKLQGDRQLAISSGTPPEDPKLRELDARIKESEGRINDYTMKAATGKFVTGGGGGHRASGKRTG